MLSSPAWDRTARRVARARLRVPPDSGRHRLASLVEEALRLASLPGENEGRVYYFRHLHVRKLPCSGDRRAWLEGFQQSLTHLAAIAVRASDPGSHSAEAVYFESATQALEIFLERLLDGRAADEWFWPLVLGHRADECELPAAIEALRDSSPSWTAVAAVLFANPGIEPVRVLQSVPAYRAQSWVRELDGTLAPPERAAVPLRSHARAALERAILVFGAEDVRVVWLAALAILLTCPGDLEAGKAVVRGRAAVRQLAPGRIGDASGPSPDADLGPAGLREPASLRHPVALPALDGPPSPAQDAPAADTSPPPANDGAPGPLESAERAAPLDTAADAVPVAPDPQILTGLSTSAAGLFFLLNALRYLELPRALADGLAWAHPDFTPRVLAHLAEHSGIDRQDPILEWVRSLMVDPAETTPGNAPESWWPANLLPSRRSAPLDRLVRAWSVAVRRWCWHAGKIAAREIVNRDGLFSVNRTDLDVSLPLDTADVRIRRLGLDLDPGWLPWFGRVVRFHYPDRRDLYD